MQTIDGPYRQIVVGSTFAGLGALLSSRPGDSVLIESTATVGWEFIEAFDPARGWEDVGELNAGALELRDELIARNILHDGRVHLPAIAPVLFKRLDTSGADYLFLTDILEVNAQSGGFEMVLSTRSGVRRIRAERIVDTTSGFLSRPDIAPRIERKLIGANLNLREGGSFDGKSVRGKGWSLTPGRFASEAFLAVELPVESEWTGAREALHGFWADRPAPLAAWDLVSVATRLAVQPIPVETGDSNWIHVPSAAHTNPLLAFAAGAETLALQGVQ